MHVKVIQAIVSGELPKDGKPAVFSNGLQSALSAWVEEEQPEILSVTQSVDLTVGSAIYGVAVLTIFYNK